MVASNSKLVFHFPVAASPAKIPLLLQILAQSEIPIRKATDLDQKAFEQSTDTNRFLEARGLAEQILGLIVSGKNGLHLTARAEVILNKRETVQLDLLHFLFYTAWSQEHPAQHLRSWSYRFICNYLWTMQNLTLISDTKNTLTQHLDNQAHLDFEGLQEFKSEKLSVGKQTLAGVLEWLSHLTPTVYEAEEFKRRSTCAAELFLLALNRSYEVSNSVFGMDLLLSPQRRDEICQLCLLDPMQFDRMLDWVIPIYPQFLAQGTRSGSYGRFVRLIRSITIEDLN